MQIQTTTRRPQPASATYGDRPAPTRVLTSLSEISWDHFVQRRQRAQAQRRALEALLVNLP